MRSVKILTNFTLLVALLVLPLNSVATQESKNELDEASRLSKRADELYQAGRYDEAIPLAERALAIVEKAIGEKALGAEHPQVAAALTILSRLYHVKGDHARAEPLYQRALAIREKALGPEHPDVALSLNYLAGLYRDKGDYTSTETLVQRALAIREKALGPEHPDVAQTLNNLALLYRDKGDYARAEPLHQRALTIWEKALGPEHPRVARALNNLALLYNDRGDYARAEPLHQRALAILEKALGPEHPDVALTLNHLARLYHNKGDHVRAEPLVQRALAIHEKALGPEHPDVGGSLINLALLYREKGDYARAEPLLQRALAIHEKAFGPQHPNVARKLNGLALLYRDKGDHARAEPLLQRALAILETALGPEHPHVAESLNNLAWLYRNKGDYVRAVQFLQRSEEIRERNLGLILTTGSEKQKQLYLNKLSGGTYAAVSLHLREVPANEHAAQLALTTILRRKGRALDAMSDQIAALRRRTAPENQQLLDRLAAAKSALATLQLSDNERLAPEARRSEATRLEVEIEQLEGDISRHSREYRALALPITLDAVRQAIPTDAALVEMFVYQPFNAKATSTDRRFDAPRYVAYVLRHDERVPKFAELGEAAGIDALVEQLRAALRDRQREDYHPLARAMDERVMRPVRKLLGSTRRLFVAPDSALDLIPFAALVDEQGHYLIEKYSLNYLTSGRDLLRLQLPGESKEQQPTLLANPLFDAKDSRPTGTLADTAKRDAEYRSLDFTKLRYTPLPGTAAEATALRRLFPDAVLLTQGQATEAALKSLARPRVLHIATHGFFLSDQPRDPSRAGREQIDDLAFGRVVPLTENPLLRSGLILAGVNQRASGGSEDGVLTALEVAALNLWGTKLVVLSACETGLGDARNGEGVYGLRRALVLAGSETQVVSLWKVSDAGTRDLMVAYYTRLKRGESRTEAMRQVQLTMLRGKFSPAPKTVADKQESNRDTDEMSNAVRAKDYRHPYYWAPFISSGDWRSLEGKSPSGTGPRPPPAPSSRKILAGGPPSP